MLTPRSNGRVPYNCFEATYDEATDFVRHAFGVAADSWSIEAEEGSPLKARVSIAALDVKPDERAKASVTAETTEPFHPRMTTGGIVMNSVTYLQIKSWKLAATLYREDRRVMNSTTALKPFDHSHGYKEWVFSASIWPSANKNIWNLLNDRTSFTATVNLVRTASSDEWTLTLSGNVIPTAGHNLPAGKAVLVEAEAHPTTISLSIKDNIPYYPGATAV